MKPGDKGGKIAKRGETERERERSCLKEYKIFELTRKRRGFDDNGILYVSTTLTYRIRKFHSFRAKQVSNPDLTNRNRLTLHPARIYQSLFYFTATRDA